MKTLCYVAAIAAVLVCVETSRADTYAGFTVGNVWDDGDGDSYGTILRSTDSGASWTRQGKEQIAEANMAGVVAVDPDTAWVVGNADATGYATIYHTTDGGTTWLRKGNGQAALQNFNLAKVTAYGDSHVWAVGSNGTHSAILHSSDAGVTWTNQAPAAYDGNGFQGVCTSDGQTIWATGKAQYDAVSGETYALIIKSTDGGQNWERQSGGDVVNWDHVNGISAANASTAWAMAGGLNGGPGNGVMGTTDGGDEWTRQLLGPGMFDGNEICAVDTQTIWAVNDSTIFRSTDGGASWDSFNQSVNYIMGVSGVSAMEAWACVYGSAGGPDLYGAIFHTADGGVTWDETGGVAGNLPALWTISFSPEPIPEPATLTLLLLGGLAVLKKRGTGRMA